MARAGCRGAGAGFPDEAYGRVGARVGDCRRVLGRRAGAEGQGAAAGRVSGFLSDEQTLFTYLHLAATARVAETLCRAGGTAIGYETVEDHGGACRSWHR